MNRDETAVVEAQIEKLVYGGEGLARVDGQVILMPFVLPGERVQAAAERVKTGLLRGSVKTIERASAERVEPRCEYFTHCGGCHYQHANYEFQVQQKVAILRETLQRLGGIQWDGEIATITGDPWFYRNRVQLHFNRGEVGFHKTGSHELCGIDHCYISSPVIVETIQKLAGAAGQPEWPEFLRSLEIFTNEEELQLNIVDSMKPVAVRFFEWCGTFLPKLARGAIEYPAAGHRFRIGRGSFFQVNRFLMDELVGEVLHQHEGQYAVDLYAGVGLFSKALAGRFERVDAVERSAPAFRDLEWNAAQGEDDNIRAIRTSAGEFLRETDETPGLIVADPPRAGLGKETTSELLRIKAPNVTLVSCDPSTLARDTKKLLANYHITRLTLVDLFPQTYHFEVVAHLERH